MNRDNPFVLLFLDLELAKYNLGIPISIRGKHKTKKVKAISSIPAIALFGTIVAAGVAIILAFFKSSDDIYQQRSSELTGLRAHCRELGDAIRPYLRDDEPIPIPSKRDSELSFHDPIIPYSSKKYFEKHINTFNFDNTYIRAVGDIHNHIERILNLQSYESIYKTERWDENKIRDEIRKSLIGICNRIDELIGVKQPDNPAVRVNPNRKIYIYIRTWLADAGRTGYLMKFFFEVVLLLIFIVASLVCLCSLNSSTNEVADSTLKIVNYTVGAVSNSTINI
ncbi:MAG: hypothetical protein ABFC89_04280 [Methanospirillum sp.]